MFWYQHMRNTVSIYCDEYDHLLGNGLVNTAWNRNGNRNGSPFTRQRLTSFRYNRHQTKKKKYWLWWPLFSSLEVIKESSFMNSRYSFVKEFRRQFHGSVFICGVLTSGQRKLKKRRTCKSEPSQSRRREDTRSPARKEASRRQSLIVRCHNDCNCKKVPINPIIKSRTHCYQSRNPEYMTVYKLVMGITLDNIS
jgi:hypothetical protein